MKLQDALNLLGLNGSGITLDMCKVAYRHASMKYHPDRNPGGLEMMKAINAAWAFLQKWNWDDGAVNVEESRNSGYGDSLNTAINAVINLNGIELEICGAWLWITGNTKPHKDIFKSSGFRWASKKKQWYFRPPEWKSANRGSWDMDRIRERHGSERVNRGNWKQEDREKLATA